MALVDFVYVGDKPHTVEQFLELYRPKSTEQIISTLTHRLEWVERILVIPDYFLAGLSEFSMRQQFAFIDALMIIANERGLDAGEPLGLTRKRILEYANSLR